MHWRSDHKAACQHLSILLELSDSSQGNGGTASAKIQKGEYDGIEIDTYLIVVCLALFQTLLLFKTQKNKKKDCFYAAIFFL